MVFKNNFERVGNCFEFMVGIGWCDVNLITVLEFVGLFDAFTVYGDVLLTDEFLNLATSEFCGLA